MIVAGSLDVFNLIGYDLFEGGLYREQGRLVLIGITHGR